MDIDLNMPGQVDPLEVIINPVNPPVANGFLELNDFVEEVEENITQQLKLEPMVQNMAQEDIEVLNNALPHVEGFPIPPLVDLVGEEIPFEQLTKLEPEAEEEDFDPNLLVGPGEDGFPDINNGGGLQLQANPDEGNILEIADELHMEDML